MIYREQHMCCFVIISVVDFVEHFEQKRNYEYTNSCCICDVTCNCNNVLCKYVIRTKITVLHCGVPLMTCHVRNKGIISTNIS